MSDHMDEEARKLQKHLGVDCWGSDTEYPREDWQAEVGAGDTNLGYWDG